jgi:hypothetical protein
MVGVRGLAGVAALIGVAAGLAGCGQTVGFRGPAIPAHTYSIPSVSAPPLPAGADAFTALQKRPMRPPQPAAGAVCMDSSTSGLGSIAPNYGQGVGPVYLSGQDAWYEYGQVALLMIDARYSGPLLVRTFRLSGEGTTLSLVGSASAVDDKEKQHGVNMTGAQITGTGGLYFEAVTPTSYWRGWMGMLSSDGPGCFGLQVDGDTFTEFIELTVNPGSPPPG